MKTREEMIPIVKENDKKLDQGIIDKFCEFTHMSTREFWVIMDKWYNHELFEQDKDGIWHEKFEVGEGKSKREAEQAAAKFAYDELSARTS